MHIKPTSNPAWCLFCCFRKYSPLVSSLSIYTKNSGHYIISLLLDDSQLTLLSVGGGGNTACSFALNFRRFTLVFLNLGEKWSHDSLTRAGFFMGSYFIIKI